MFRTDRKEALKAGSHLLQSASSGAKIVDA
jgi:hypothetical protein